MVLLLLAVVEADKEASDDERSSKPLSSCLLLLPRRFSDEAELEEGARAASMSEFFRRNRFNI